jgi:hypothetical protein
MLVSYMGNSSGFLYKMLYSRLLPFIYSSGILDSRTVPRIRRYDTSQTFKFGSHFARIFCSLALNSISSKATVTGAISTSLKLKGGCHGFSSTMISTVFSRTPRVSS